MTYSNAFVILFALFIGATSVSAADVSFDVTVTKNFTDAERTSFKNAFPANFAHAAAVAGLSIPQFIPTTHIQIAFENFQYNYDKVVDYSPSSGVTVKALLFQASVIPAGYAGQNLENIVYFYSKPPDFVSDQGLANEAGYALAYLDGATWKPPNAPPQLKFASGGYDKTFTVEDLARVPLFTFVDPLAAATEKIAELL